MKKLKVHLDTNVGDMNGKRTGYTLHVLKIEGRHAIPVAAGAETSLRRVHIE
jgi:hypothetical protein